MPPALARLARTGVLLGLTWAVLTAPLVLIGEAVERSPRVQQLDRAVTAFVVDHRTPALDRLMQALTWTGSWIAALALVAVLAVLTWTRRLPVVAVVAVAAAWLGEQLAISLTKNLVQRPRPPEAVRLVATHGWSFPSGHTANAVVVFATTTALVAYAARGRFLRVLACVVGAAAIALIAFSRVELGAHWLADVVASTVWTTTWLLLATAVLRRGAAGQGPAAPLLRTRERATG